MHIDGFIATVAETVVVGEAGAAPAPVTGPRADVLAAAHAAAEAAVRLIKPGNTNTQVTEAVAAIAAAYGVTPVQGVLMHEMKRCVAQRMLARVRGAAPRVVELLLSPPYRSRSLARLSVQHDHRWFADDFAAR